jgi:hypothetical protein
MHRELLRQANIYGFCNVRENASAQFESKRGKGCAPQKPLQVTTCMTPGADSNLFLPLAKELCSAFLLCAKLISHVATSMRLAALLLPQPFGPLGTAAGWIAVPERRRPFANGRSSGSLVLT